MNQTHGIETIIEPEPRYHISTISCHAYLTRAYVSAVSLLRRNETRKLITRRACVADGMRSMDWIRGIKMLRASGALIKNYDMAGGYEVVVGQEMTKLLLTERRKRDVALINSGRIPTYARVPPRSK